LSVSGAPASIALDLQRPSVQQTIISVCRIQSTWQSPRQGEDKTRDCAKQGAFHWSDCGRNLLLGGWGGMEESMPVSPRSASQKAHRARAINPVRIAGGIAVRRTAMMSHLIGMPFVVC
jgi:hypothetical protein